MIRPQELANEDNIQIRPYSLYIGSEKLMFILKLLNYENGYILEKNIKPLDRYYFAIETNSGEQFYVFTTLAAWLISKIGKNCELPQEFDHPNATISIILNSMKELGISVDFPSNKLKAGYGYHVIITLLELAHLALKKNNISLKKPNPHFDITPIDNHIEKSDDEINAEDEFIGDISENIYDYDGDNDDDLDDEDDNEKIPFKTDLNKIHYKHQKDKNNEDVSNIHINLESWELERERVLPKLKIVMRHDYRDWRSHLQQISQYRSSIEESIDSSSKLLDKMYKDLTKTMEKALSREKYLNSNFDNYIQQYKILFAELIKIQRSYQEVNGGVTERSKLLSKISEEMENIKQEIEEKGSSMTDGTPLVNIKKAINKIKQEIGQMDIRIGILQQGLLHFKLNNKLLLLHELNSAT